MTLSMHIVGHHGLSGPFGGTPQRAYASFRRFSCAIAHHFLGDLDSDVKNAKIFCGRPSRPWICRKLAITVCSTHFQGQTSPEDCIHPFQRFSCVTENFFLVIWILTSKMPKVFMDVCQDLGFAASWPLRPVRPIFKVKRALKHIPPI